MHHNKVQNMKSSTELLVLHGGDGDRLPYEMYFLCRMPGQRLHRLLVSLVGLYLETHTHRERQDFISQVYPRRGGLLTFLMDHSSMSLEAFWTNNKTGPN